MTNAQFYVAIGVPFFTIIVVWIGTTVSNRTALTDFRLSTQSAMNDLRSEMHASIEALRSEMKMGFDAVNQRLDRLAKAS